MKSKQLANGQPEFVGSGGRISFQAKGSKVEKAWWFEKDDTKLYLACEKIEDVIGTKDWTDAKEPKTSVKLSVSGFKNFQVNLEVVRQGQGVTETEGLSFTDFMDKSRLTQVLE